MNEISYDKWQAIIRLPYLIVLAFYVAQRGKVYRSQIQCLIDHVAEESRKDPASLLAQIADDSMREFLAHFANLKAADVTHFTLQVTRSIEAAKSVLSPSQYEQYLIGIRHVATQQRVVVPWHGRLRALLIRPPRTDLRQSLERLLA